MLAIAYCNRSESASSYEKNVEAAGDAMNLDQAKYYHGGPYGGAIMEVAMVSITEAMMATTVADAEEAITAVVVGIEAAMVIHEPASPHDFKQSFVSLQVFSVSVVTASMYIREESCVVSFHAFLQHYSPAFPHPFSTVV
ncbi:hypothetical protein KP509_37G030400 [Ceratopteris richardii]|uniref:Uncharacterized protein n=1 Tax=Ceratopteris richardii TaxID=49495 RepID=A0A8T2Q6J6_CERRI|nr:hypothetical protein KP509_37G030400 [Ceratopteris richardii]